jgi:23S rRNA pseudouridine2604 synthase
MASLIRLNRLVAQKGICSRREADTFISQGLVKVDGRIISELGTKVRPNANVELMTQATTAIQRKGTLLLHKPLGVVSSQPEEDQVPAIHLCTKENEHILKFRNDNKHPLTEDKRFRQEPRRQPGWASAGRLDINSTGLLVLTQSGLVAKQIIGPDNSLDKEYLVRLRHKLVDEDAETKEKLHQLQDGVMHEDDLLSLKSVRILNESQLQIVLNEGKKHHIRRMLQCVGWKIDALKRVRIGGVVLGDLPVGKWRWLRNHEKF